MGTSRPPSSRCSHAHTPIGVSLQDLKKIEGGIVTNCPNREREYRNAASVMHASWQRIGSDYDLVHGGLFRLGLSSSQRLRCSRHKSDASSESDMSAVRIDPDAGLRAQNDLTAEDMICAIASTQVCAFPLITFANRSGC